MVRCVSYAIDRKNLERQRLRLVEIEHERARLREALAAQEQLLGVVGHELRTPLASIRALSEVLLSDACDAAQRDEFLHAVNREVVRMAGIVNDLLDAARLNSGAVRWTWDTVRLADACGEAVESIRPLVDGSAVRLECSIEPPGLSMRGDASALRRLALNLLSNAQKHTPSGSIALRARAGARGEIVLEVRDTGSGIRPEIGERLGTPFALNAGNAGGTHVQGTGLGIAICKGIVGAHGGAMEVVSGPEGGTTVTVRLRGDLPQPAAAGDVPIRLEIDAGAAAGERAA
jgi:signal transduction histidine kinase